MKEYFGIPWEELDYPYGAAGADDLWSRLERRFGLDYHQARAELDRQIAEGAGKAYPYLQALYGMPAAILASGPRADGLRRFLEQELGMEVVCFARREELSDQEDFYRELRGSESALLFGSSFEQDGADELEIPLIRMDYPCLLYTSPGRTGRRALPLYAGGSAPRPLCRCEPGAPWKGV